ncbi:hypothetical protein Vau01_122810 [Virgisporangium aurantiacum]|uniref:Uncharacterized protein n=1 Tax=Virgisporangium aurantiacum TaxID=175570 RepID=A0A8J4E751_9ACTN|nr:hypothetical protein Vau01_122810 [Virgisporangium aurantiacum]
MLVAAISTLILGSASLLVTWDLTRRAIHQGRGLTITKTPGITRITLQASPVPKAESELRSAEFEDPPNPQPRSLSPRGKRKRKGGGR